MKALDFAGGGFATEDVISRVEDGRFQAWQEGDSVVVTEILGYPRARVMNVVLAAGDMDEVLACQKQFVPFARQQGCKKVVMRGRKGWRKVLPKHGWREEAVTFDLPLGDTQ